MNARSASLRVLRLGAAFYPPEHDHHRPRVRRDCEDMERPCPYVSCKYHLYLDVDPRNGTIKLNFPHLAPHELTETCALDVADRGGITLEQVGDLTNLTRERARQVEALAMQRVRARSDPESMSAFANALELDDEQLDDFDDDEGEDP